MANQENRPEDRERVEIAPEDVGTLEISGEDMDRYRLVTEGSPHTKLYMILYVEPGVDYNPIADERFIIKWEDADLIIPWPKDQTMKDAILAWADEQRKE